MLESAIPPHLIVERTRPVSTPENYDPPFPAYSARFEEKTKDIVMAIFGAQGQRHEKLSDKAHLPILDFIKAEIEQAPSFWEIASVVDVSGYENRTVISYWRSRDEYERWSSTSGFDAWWSSLEPDSQPNGWFLEAFFPSVDRFETVFSDNQVPEGAAYMREGVSGTIKEHVYWGSARDRLPVAQTDAIEGQKYRPVVADLPPKPKDTTKRRIRVPGRPNACVIRSGQDWSATRPTERTLYLDTMHPVLTDGMDFLRDEGEAIGCYCCRFMSVVDSNSLEANKDRTFGLAYFDDLDSLEVWSREHPTHLRIFGGFLKYAKELNNDVSLRLFHEVLVLQPGQQLLEYIGCRPKTGFLTGYSDE